MLLGSFGFMDSEDHNNNNDNNNNNEIDEFPTSIFESLLQNDELMKALFKPIDSNNNINTVNFEALSEDMATKFNECKFNKNYILT